MHEQHNSAANDSEDHPNEPVPSIQLIPDHPLSQGQGSGLFRRDKKGPSLPSVNNFIQKTYAILQEKQY